MGPLSTRKWACLPGRCQGVSLLPTASCFPARGSGQLCSLSIHPSFSVWAVSLGAEDSEPGQWQLVHAGHHTLVRMLVEKSASVCPCSARARVHEDVGGGQQAPLPWLSFLSGLHVVLVLSRYLSTCLSVPRMRESLGLCECVYLWVTSSPLSLSHPAPEHSPGPAYRSLLCHRLTICKHQHFFPGRLMPKCTYSAGQPLK